MNKDLCQLDRRRARAGISREKLAAAAGASRQFMEEAMNGQKSMSPALFRRWTFALNRLERSDDSAASHQVHIVYLLSVVLVCSASGEDPVAVLTQDPARKSTGNKRWLALSRLRQRALYLAHVICGLSQKDLARAVGVSPAAVSLAIGAVEDTRSDCEDQDDALFAQLEAIVGAL